MIQIKSNVWNFRKFTEDDERHLEKVREYKDRNVESVSIKMCMTVINIKRIISSNLRNIDRKYLIS